MLFRSAKGLLECAADWFGEEFGDPDGGDDGLGPVETTMTLPAAVALLREFYALGAVWACDKVAKRVYSADELREMFVERLGEEA